MKKLYFLAAAALLTAGSASAKSFTLYAGETEVTNGAEIIVGEDKIELTDLSEYGIDQVDYKYDPELYVVTDESANMTVNAKCTSGQNIQLCFGGACRDGKELTQTGLVEAGKRTGLLFDAIGSVTTIGELPEISAEVTVQYADDADSAVKVYVVMGPKASIQVVKFDPSFCVGNGVINYDLNGAAVASIYNLNGAEVLRANISGQGTISTANLPKGVYVYRLQGAKNIAGKLIVR